MRPFRPVSVRRYLPHLLGVAAYATLGACRGLLPRPHSIYWMIGIVWTISVGFLWLYSRWNGPSPLRRIGDEIRIIPHYRSLVAKGLFSPRQMGPIYSFYALTLIATFLIRGELFLLFLIWGTPGYFGLVATYIRVRLEKLLRPIAVAQAVFWGAIYLWMPVIIWFLIRMIALILDLTSLSITALVFFYSMSMALFFLALYVPIRYTIPSYRRALREIEALKREKGAACAAEL